MAQISLPDEQSEQHELDQQAAALEAQIAGLQWRLSARSIPPAMLAALDELDGQLAAARKRLAQVKNSYGAAG
jgi:hypothetical protein